VHGEDVVVDGEADGVELQRKEQEDGLGQPDFGGGG